MSWSGSSNGESAKTIYVSYLMWRRAASGEWAVTAVLTEQEVDTRRNVLCSQAKKFRVEKVVAERKHAGDTEHEDDAPNCGVLEDGRRYVTYRMLL